MKLSTKLPDGDHNGLASVEKDMLAEPKKPRVALLIIDGEKTVTNVSTGSRELTARIRHIDLLHPDDMGLVERLLRRAAEYRTGQAMLPISMEDEIDRILTSVLAQAAGPEPEAPESGSGEEGDSLPVPYEDEDGVTRTKTPVVDDDGSPKFSDSGDDEPEPEA